MEHTKGKLTVMGRGLYTKCPQGGFTRVLLVDDEKDVGHTLKCWNSHDALLEALKRTLAAMKSDELNRVFDDDLRKEVKEIAKQAIAKAGP